MFEDSKKKYMQWRRIRESQGCVPLEYFEWLDWKERERKDGKK